MVKIRLRRIGGKGHPVYRVVVAESSAGRNGNVVESIGLYDPVAQPKQLEINEERALHWLRLGAQPSETTAFILNKLGILPKFLEERPAQKKKYPFLNKAIAATSATVPGTAAPEA
ncbi:MAG: 30S ribosomal protein S16 [Fimbriimonas sp.]